VTAASRSDVISGWRARRAEGGIVIDVASGAVVTEKLSMPHSPRWYDNRLWVLNSGTGHLGTVDLTSGDFTPPRSVRASCAGWRFTTATPWSACRCRAMVPSRVSRSTRSPDQIRCVVHYSKSRLPVSEMGQTRKW
jgi:Domain of unknown function (DUF4915)